MTTTLKGVNSLADTDLSQLLSANFIMFLDWGLLDKGGFASVRLGDSNIHSADRSKLRLSDDPDYSAGRVWETFHQNLVWESGVSVANQPINISGVYVNNSFKPTSGTGPYAHHVEYTTGRVVFDSGIATSSTVKMEYSYKTISVVEAKDYPLLREVQFRIGDPYSNGFTQTGSGEYNKSPNNRISLPLIGVEVTPRVSSTPHEMGSAAARTHTTILLHVLGENDSIVKKLVSILTKQKENTIWLLDMDMMARSGAFPLDYLGVKSANPQIYPSLANENGYRYYKTYILEAQGTNGDWVSNNLYHGVTQLTTETIL